MPYTAIAFPVLPGHDEDIGRVFSAHQGGSTIAHDADGREIGRTLGTAVFVRDDLLIRVIQYRGDLDQVLLRLGGFVVSSGVSEQLAPYVPAEQGIDSPESFAAHFRSSQLPCVFQKHHPAG